jgi:hypothetical protein
MRSLIDAIRTTKGATKMTVISTELYERGLAMVRIPSDFSTEDIVRISDYFDGDVNEVGSFLRNVWLPDALATLREIKRASASPSAERMTYLCKHLRCSAVSVGAHQIASDADQLYSAALLQEPELLGTVVDGCLHRLANYSLQLRHCY